MNNVIQQLINGVALGSIYALMALGYTMVYGIIGLINFAHGDIYMVGAFVGFTLITNVGMGVFPALILAMLFTAVLGVIIERVAYKPLRGATRIAALITAIGVSMLLQNVMIFLRGPEVRAFPADLPDWSLQLGSFTINSQQILILAVTIILMIALQVIVQKTKLGQAMRAVSVDPDAAQLMGINANTIISFTFLIGSALAGAAGVLVGIYYNSISPLMGVNIGTKTFVAAVVGGIGSIPGAVLGGLIIGIVETFVSMIGLSTWKDAAVYIILIIILLVKPTGLLGKPQVEKV
ncbi:MULTISPECIES: branched-chain amino acid ABC transporter permease [Aerococcus]|uniref:branched-chain amino acid ABC transporter permease n=1 Tax=Aerococcus urinae (strain CCUG 59500 / ACS-120-V-Col10a) TaxID=2976812 RepID=UPI000200F56E|nr:branched-chain amino acid ABC transporter permease [Aerococcus sp. Group 1]AEA00664.1 branched-chain amino acid ABC transporter, permease protein [Aerococcus sp. Group 1]MCY3030302.1 branched-chain amino acid ABC transporter permease [Aerococcus sp. Group 1]MCY3054989.1 branched-chain amino acid ABC transporter permease [Aerococcus sp. Group 1]MCY3056719.1 branched-chain amino acid ABC transporter permease [Aerococcus sp. Group 1]MCY3061490.1 branched-chain amino acid ABC transporter permea